MDNQQYTMPPPLPERNQTPPPPCRTPGLGMRFLQSCLAAGCATIVVPFALIFGFFGFLYFLASDSIIEASKSVDSIYSSGGMSNIREKVLRPGADGTGTIVLVTIHGAITGDGSPLEGEGMLAQVAEELRNAAENDKVKAVLLQIDSPGGGLTASDQIHHEIRKLREAGKTVIAWAGGTMASGGYYIAVACEGIMASPTCTVGSIGVLLQHFQVEGLMQMLGIKVDPIASGERKTMGSPFRDMSPEERKILQNFVNTSHRRFVGIVAAGRNLPLEEVTKLADGGIFVPEDALAHGLIDKIGYIEDAVTWVEEITGEADMRLITYRRLLSFGDLLRETGRGVTGALIETSGAEATPKTMAIWNGKN